MEMITFFYVALFLFFVFLNVKLWQTNLQESKMYPLCHSTNEGRLYLCCHSTHQDSSVVSSLTHLQVTTVLGTIQEGHFTLDSFGLLGGFLRGLLCFQFIGLHFLCLSFCCSFCLVFLYFLYLLLLSFFPYFFSRLLIKNIKFILKMTNLQKTTY